MSSTTTAPTIAVLRDWFARYGLPRQIVTDNAPQFTSEEFKVFMSTNAIKHIRSATYHASTNGAAERMVQTMKQALKSSHQDGRPLHLALAGFLLSYRTTPHSTMGVTLSSLFVGRELRTRLDLLSPDIGARVKQPQKDYQDKRRTTRHLSVGQIVWARNFREGTKWVQATVVDQVGPLSYHVQVQNGEMWRRHIDHLRAGSEQSTSSDTAEVTPEQRAEEFVLVPSCDAPEESTLSETATTYRNESNDRNESSNRNNSNDRSESESGTANVSDASRPRYPQRHRKPPDRYS